jgi:hypothetical protein
MAAGKKRNFKGESLEDLVTRLAEGILAHQKGGPEVYFKSRVLDLVDQAIGDDLKWVAHRAEYQALVAATVGEYDPTVGDFVAEMNEESFSKICTRSGRTFTEDSPSEWSTRTPLELRNLLQAIGGSDDVPAVKALIDFLKKEEAKKS